MTDLQKILDTLEPPRPPKRRRKLWLFLSATLLIAACWLAWGCGQRAAVGVVSGVAGKALPTAPTPTSSKDADAQLEAMRSQRDDLECRIARVEKERDAIAQQDLRRRLAWLGGIVLIGVLASVGLWFILPAGLKSWAVYGGLGCLGIAAAAFALRALVPYLELIGCGLIACGVAFGLWKLSRFKRAGAQSAIAFDRLEESFAGMKDWIPEDKHLLIDDLIADVKHGAAKAQTDAGVRGVLAAIRGRNPHAPTVAPLRPVAL